MIEEQPKVGLKWWMVPHRDHNYQWWWGYQKVRMIKLPESEKQKFLEWHNGVKAKNND